LAANGRWGARAVETWPRRLGPWMAACFNTRQPGRDAGQLSTSCWPASPTGCMFSGRRLACVPCFVDTPSVPGDRVNGSGKQHSADAKPGFLNCFAGPIRRTPSFPSGLTFGGVGITGGHWAVCCCGRVACGQRGVLGGTLERLPMTDPRGSTGQRVRFDGDADFHCVKLPCNLAGTPARFAGDRLPFACFLSWRWSRR